MRRITITKVVDKYGVTYKAKKPTKVFQEGEIVKFIFPDNEIIAIVRTDSTKDSVCSSCIWGVEQCNSPIVDEHRLCGFITHIDGRFERLDNVLEDL